MATFFFDGTTSQSINFDVENDQIVFELDASQVASVTSGTNGTTITTTTGTSLTFVGLSAVALAEAAVLPESFLQFGTDSANTLTAGTAGSVILGNAGADRLNGGAGDDLLAGNVGNDTIVGGGGSDRLFGGQGNDVVVVANSSTNASDASVLVEGGLGRDAINLAGSFAESSGSFTASGTFAGSATIFGGNNDLADTADGADTITAALSDTGTLVAYGNAGADSITVTGTGEASVYGGLGNDTINAAVSEGLFVGGQGNDTISVDTNTSGADAVTVFGGNQADGAGDGADNITVTLGAGDSALVYGNAGADVIVFDGAVNASVTAFGGQGNDNISGTVGDGSQVFGGIGADIINLTVNGAGSSVSVYGGNNIVGSEDGIDNITVTLSGTGATANTAEIYGNAGNDVITLLGAGEATVFGGAGDDRIAVGTGTAGGSASGDVAGTGVYELTGGAGVDTFDFQNIGTAGFSGATIDNVTSITDLNLDEDKIDFGDTIDAVFNVSATATTGASLSAAAVSAFNTATATTTAGADAVVLFTYQGAQYLVHADVEITSGAGSIDAADIEHLVQVTGFTGTLSTSDFVS